MDVSIPSAHCDTFSCLNDKYIYICKTPIFGILIIDCIDDARAVTASIGQDRYGTNFSLCRHLLVKPLNSHESVQRYVGW